MAADKLPPNFDPSQPIQDSTREAFAHMLVAGKDGFEAYKVAKGGKIRYETAKQQASRWAKEPELAERIKWLRIQAAKAQISAPSQPIPQPVKPAPRNRPEAPPVAPSTEAMGRAELYALITAEIRTGRVDPALVSSLLKVAPELGEVDQRRPDPTAVISYVCSFAGRPGCDIAKELGGLEYIAGKVCNVLKVSPLDLASILQAKGHTKVTDTHNPQAGSDNRLNTHIHAGGDARTQSDDDIARDI